VPAGGRTDQFKTFVELLVCFARIVFGVSLGIRVRDLASALDEGQDTDARFPRRLAYGAELPREIMATAFTASSSVGFFGILITIPDGRKRTPDCSS
jgi:hypothetical protein